MLRLLKSLLFVAALAAGAAAADTLSVVPPMAPGRYDVGCSDVTQDFSRVRAGESPDDYWEGIPDTGGNGRYVTSLFTSPDSLVVNVHVPADGELFGAQAGQTASFATIVCYPTEANTRADYRLPGGQVVPHMQQNGAAPLFASAEARFPVLLFSHGLSGSPLSDTYLRAVTLLASHGYVVVAPFHGDERYARIKLDDLGDVVNAVLHFREYTAMQALRPLALSAALDAVLANPSFGARMDASRVGGFGGSLGGESLMLMAGGRLTYSVGLASRQVIRDTRLKAAVGYVPYFGNPLLPAFGRDQEGLDDVDVPYLAISGTADTTAPAVTTGIGMLRLTKAARQFVVLDGVTHGFDTRSQDDIFTWSVTFLDAYVRNDPLQRARSARMESVGGGGDDHLLLDYASPITPGADERVVVEFYNTALDHYFITAEPAEAAMLDAGVLVPGWRRTGFEFKVHAPDSPSGTQACRFFGTPGRGPNSHFFTIDPAECEKVKANADWTYEGLAFKADLPTLEDCPANRIPVIRLYNNGKGGQANHRFLTSHSEIVLQLSEGWIREGAVFCGVP